MYKFYCASAARLGCGANGGEMSIEGTFLNSRNSCASARFQSDGRKRASILEAARRVFLDRGFAAASMNEIVRESGISKATIYNHFTNKLALFEGVIRLEYSNVAEQRLEYDNNAWDVGAVLHQVGMSFMTRMVQPDHIRLLRIVIATSERFPEIGRVFFESGPCSGEARLAGLLREQVQRGQLKIVDVDIAATQLLNLYQCNLVTRLLFGGEAVATEQIQEVVTSAVQIFIAAYCPEP